MENTQEEQITVTLAPKRIRLIASVIDYTLYFIFFYFMVKYFGTTEYLPEGGVSYQLTGLPSIVSMLVWFLLIPVIEGINGQSIGKIIFGIKVITHDGYRITTVTAIVRHLFDLVDFFPFLGAVGLIVASRNDLNQRVGDMVAKTIVIKK